MKTLIRQRIKALAATLKTKELKLKEDKNFNYCTQEIIHLMAEDIKNLEIFLDLDSNDSVTKSQVTAKFNDALDRIEKRIHELEVIPVHGPGAHADR